MKVEVVLTFLGQESVVSGYFSRTGWIFCT